MCKDRLLVTFVVLSLIQLAGCNGNLVKPDTKPEIINIPNVNVVPATSFPQFDKEMNEVQIADSYNEVDPTLVVGALVDVTTGKVRSLDNYLKKDAKPQLTTKTEIAFKNFIENSVAANAAWLDFVKGQVNDKTRAEVTVIKTAKVAVDGGAIDKAALLDELKTVPKEKLKNYGIIVGYIDYVLSASYFRDSGAEVSASGYGAKIGGNWYSKYENSSAYHKLVAVWSPLPFVLDPEFDIKVKDISKATLDAINSGSIKVNKLNTLRIQVQ